MSRDARYILFLRRTAGGVARKVRGSPHRMAKKPAAVFRGYFGLRLHQRWDGHEPANRDRKLACQPVSACRLGRV